MNKELKQRIEQINAGTAPASYKKTKVGIVPEEWEIKKLSAILHNESRPVPKPTEPYTRIGIRSHAKGTFQELVENPEEVNMDVLYEVRQNDLIVNITFAWEHAIALATENDDGKLVSHRFPTYVFDNNSPVYYRYVFGQEMFRQRLELISPGGAGRNRVLNKTDFLALEIFVPPLPEQQKIAEILTAQDAVIALMQKQIELLQKQKKAFLQKMFPKKGCTVPEIRFAGLTDAWEQRKLGECVTFLDTMRKPLKESEREKGIYPYYGASGIVDYVSDYIFDEELVLLSEDGANITDRNYPVCFLASGKYWVNNHAHVLKVNAENENNFICNSLERMDFTQYNSGMAMPKLNKDVCHNIPLFCPIYEEQKQIGDFFRNLDNLITLHQRKLEIEQQKKKALMQLLLTGKVRVKT